jgi:hypothetical protein
MLLMNRKSANYNGNKDSPAAGKLESLGLKDYLSFEILQSIVLLEKTGCYIVSLDVHLLYMLCDS